MEKRTTYKTTLKETIQTLRAAKKLILEVSDILPDKKTRKTEILTIYNLNNLINLKITELEELEQKGKLYQFYYQYQINGEEHIVTEKRCKRPTATKIWKQLEENRNKGYIIAYGYNLIRE